MSQNTEVESDPTSTESGDSDVTDKVEVNRTAEDYAKRVVELSAENKKRKQRENELKAKLADLESRQLSAEEEKAKENGKYKDAYEKSKAELEKIKTQAVKDKQSFAFKIVTGHLAQAAAKVGCLDTDAMIKLAGSYGFLDDLEPDEEFNLTEDNLKSVIEQAQSKMPFLFGKPAPAIKDGTPKSKVTTEKKSLDQLSLHDRIKMLSQIDMDRTAKAMESGERRAFKSSSND